MTPTTRGRRPVAKAWICPLLSFPTASSAIPSPRCITPVYPQVHESPSPVTASRFVRVQICKATVDAWLSGWRKSNFQAETGQVWCGDPHCCANVLVRLALSDLVQRFQHLLLSPSQPLGDYVREPDTSVRNGLDWEPQVKQAWVSCRRFTLKMLWPSTLDTFGATQGGGDVTDRGTRFL